MFSVRSTLAMEELLLKQHELPKFSELLPEHLERRLDEILSLNRNDLKKALTERDVHTWETLMRPLEIMDTRLSEVWIPIQQMISVSPSKDLQDAYQRCLSKLSEYAVALGQNLDLYQAMESILNNKEENILNQTQIKVLENYLQVFYLSGVHLPDNQKTILIELQQKLLELENQFEQNVQNATANGYLMVAESFELEGLPAEFIQAAAHKANIQKEQGYLLGLEESSYLTVLQCAQSRQLRENLYKAYITRASEHDVKGNKFDNGAIIDQILLIRSQMAQILGFDNFAQRSLAMNMLKQPNEVEKFLLDLANKSIPAAKEEISRLEFFAKEQDGIMKIEPWDIEYYTEKLKKKLYSYNEELLKCYFPVDKVLTGLFNLSYQLFDICIEEIPNPDVWYPDVRLFRIYGKNKNLHGYFYLDLYSRPNKRDTSWIEQYRTRCRAEDGSWQIPVVLLMCNFHPAEGHKPPLLSHEDVRYLFHEFGHTLHHLLTDVEYSGVSGINGVPTDALEIPSLFMENWIWEERVIRQISSNYKTAEPLPAHIISNLNASKNFNAAIKLVQRIRLALIDIRLHSEYSQNIPGYINNVLNDAEEIFSFLPSCMDDRFLHSFSLIFSYGYAAKYYSYLWAEMIASDIFSKFKNHGLFSKEVGHSFMSLFLQSGGSCDPIEQFKKFHGRNPSEDALLHYRGIRR